jgi:putative flippase GtrA
VVDRSFIAMTRETFTDLSGGDERYYCREWATTHATTRALAGVAVLTVVVVNMLLARVLDALVGIEKHQTQSSRVVSRVIKVFLAQFCNTAVLMVALNANIDYFLNHKSETNSVSSSDGDSNSVYTLESLLKLCVTAREVFRRKYSDFSLGTWR